MALTPIRCCLLHTQYRARGGIILLLTQIFYQPRNPMESAALRAVTTISARAYRTYEALGARPLPPHGRGSDHAGIGDGQTPVGRLRCAGHTLRHTAGVPSPLRDATRYPPQ